MFKVHFRDFTAILWHELSAGGVQGWTDFVWSSKIGSGLAQIVWSWKIGSGLARIVWSWTIGIFGSSAIFLPHKICSGQACPLYPKLKNLIIQKILKSKI
jgi:hypothetical protein